MAQTLSFSVPRRDLQKGEDSFEIRSDLPLTASIITSDTATGVPALRGITACDKLDETDSDVMRLVLELLLGDYREVTRVDSVTVIDSCHLRVTGTWLNAGLLRHWISQKFEQDDDVTVDTASSFEMRDLVFA